MASNAPPPPPPPPPPPAHPIGCSSLAISDITMGEMSEDEEAHHPTLMHQHQEEEEQPGQYYKPLVPNDNNDEYASSFMEYSQSSDEGGGYGGSNHRNSRHQRSDSNFSTTTTFRFREDLNNSSRMVRFASSSSGANNFTRRNGQNPTPNNREMLQEDSPLQKLRNDFGDNEGAVSRRHRHHHQKHHRGGGGGGGSGSSAASSSAVNRETFLSTPNRWVTQLAYSFRTPPPPKQLRKQPLEEDRSSMDTASTTGATAPAKTTATATATRKETKRNINKNNNIAVDKKRFQPGSAEAGSKLNNNNSERTPLLPSLQEEEEAFSIAAFHNNARGRGGPKRQQNDDDNSRTDFWSQQQQQHGHRKLFAASHLHRHPYDYISMAVAFLKDYEAGRPATLASNVHSITPWHLGLYRVKYSTAYHLLLCSATLSLFMSSALEGPSPANSNLRMHTISCLNLYALFLFAIDLWIRGQFKTSRQTAARMTSTSTSVLSSNKKTLTSLPVMVHPPRTSQADMLTRPLWIFFLFLGLENLGWLLAKPDRTFVVFYSSIGKPIVLYYVSSKARRAMEAILQIARHVTRVLLIEMVLILSFAAVACRLFTDFEPFEHLSIAWLSLFELSTTVVNPSIWMPMYHKTKWSAIFFVLFIVVTIFYMHSLVLSVVFQTYIQATTDIHDRSVTDRENAIQLAFAALKKQNEHDARKQQSHRQQSGQDERNTRQSQQQITFIPMYLVREVLEKLRPHYNSYKINALMEIFDTPNAKDLDYSTFRMKIRQALNASIRTARVASPLSMSIELAAVVVAVGNFVYVILLTSSFSAVWFDTIQLEIGVAITVAGLVELLMRANPLRVQNFTPMTRFNPTFDGLAIFAASISSVGIGMSLINRELALEYILMGRAVDMIRVMRFFQFFREVVRRSSEVLPALTGPITLIMTMLHIFCYIGIAFWGGAIVVGELTEEEITPLYDLNNFNSYMEGLVTMFQVLVVNDWHAIAGVFRHASRCSNPEIVYPFFIIGNLVGVSILLNVITAFFVEAFVYKLNGNESGAERGAGKKDFSIKTSENSGVRRITSSHSLTHLIEEDDSDAHDADSEGSSDSSEVFEFDVLEREGYDKIIQTVSGVQDQDGFARQVCTQLELFESLTPGREKVGYLVCCQQTMNRYGNRRFESEASNFVSKMELHSIVSEMHGELLALLLSSKESFGDRSLIRVLSHPTDLSKQLEVSATIVRRHPALSLFVSRIVAK